MADTKQKQIERSGFMVNFYLCTVGPNAQDLVGKKLIRAWTDSKGKIEEAQR